MNIFDSTIKRLIISLCCITGLCLSFNIDVIYNSIKTYIFFTLFHFTFSHSILNFLNKKTSKLNTFFIYLSISFISFSLIYFSNFENFNFLKFIGIIFSHILLACYINEFLYGKCQKDIYQDIYHNFYKYNLKTKPFLSKKILDKLFVLTFFLPFLHELIYIVFYYNKVDFIHSFVVAFIFPFILLFCIVIILKLFNPFIYQQKITKNDIIIYLTETNLTLSFKENKLHNTYFPAYIEGAFNFKDGEKSLINNLQKYEWYIEGEKLFFKNLNYNKQKKEINISNKINSF